MFAENADSYQAESLFTNDRDNPENLKREIDYHWVLLYRRLDLTMRNFKSFLTGASIGTLGGLMGLGGAEYRLPVLVAAFRFGTLQAIILNLVISLVTVFFSFIFRTSSIALETVFSCGFLVVILLVFLSFLVMSEHYFSFSGEPLFTDSRLMFFTGALTGFFIGMVSSVLGVAGGELLIPTFMLLYGVEIKLAGSLALAVSFPTVIVGITKYRTTNAFKVVHLEKTFIAYMASGSIAGAYCGSLLLGIVPASALSLLLGIILLISAVKIFYSRSKTK